ncbi:MAG: BMP family ABC transporter substrate-binding protein [Lachnospiraceae bacterium]|nr:BMP family ABC transporter substrate-binding protein [Lachnospiraceae bacterium]
MVLSLTACGNSSKKETEKTTEKKATEKVVETEKTTEAETQTEKVTEKTTEAETQTEKATEKATEAETKAEKTTEKTTEAETKKEAVTRDEDFKAALVIGVGGLGDGSFNDSMKAGMDEAVEKYGITYQLVEPTEVAEFEGHFTDLSASGEYDLIVAGGFDAAEAMTNVATEFPEQKYLFVDGVVEGLDNVTSVTYRDNEKTYLLGVMAAMTTKTNKLGVVLGIDTPSLIVFAAGFMAGAYSANPDVEVNVKYVGSFADTTTAKELAMALNDEGADIVYAAAGGSGLGVFSAASEKGFLAIGADTNQCLLDPDVIMVSGIRLVDVTICNGIGAAIEGTLEGGSTTEGLAEGALTYTNEGSKVEISKEAIDAAEEAREKIIAGEIVVPDTYEGVEK